MLIGLTVTRGVPCKTIHCACLDSALFADAVMDPSGSMKLTLSSAGLQGRRGGIVQCSITNILLARGGADGDSASVQTID